MRVRSSQTLVLSPQGSELVAFNFLSKSVFCCTLETLHVLQWLDDWRGIDETIQFIPDSDAGRKRRNIREMIEVTAIVEEHSDQAVAESEFLQNWDWGIPAALMHFSLTDAEFLSPDDVEELQTRKAAETPSPKLFCQNSKFDDVRQLPDSLAGNDLLQLMARRRTVRNSLPQAISIQQLSDCLFAGMGITGETHNCVCKLPLSMTPSGGARNPFEAYVYARNVDGLAPGFYHYSALEHSLARLPTTLSPHPSELLAAQAWADDKPGIIFLAAM